MTITSDYGKRKKPCPTCSEDHKGIDLRAGVGSPIYARKDLEVSRIQDFGDSGFGKAIYVKDPADPSKEYIFAHLDDNNPGNLKRGDIIPNGALIGYSGKTGVNASPHVHYEVRKNGMPIDPKNDVDIASFEKNRGNMITSTATVDKNRAKRPGVAPVVPDASPSKPLSEIAEARRKEQERIGPGSNTRPRPARSDVGVLINPRHILGDGG
jgi:murein DD-endopeptidase MepM/ murein hydrolase activator NlpD